MSDFKEVALPVTQVLCLEDRAQVERRGKLKLEAGIHRLRLAGISALAVDRSLKVDAAGAEVVDAGVRRRWKEKPPVADTDPVALRQRLKELGDRSAQLAAEKLRAEARLEVVGEGRSEVLRAIGEGSGAGEQKSELWSHGLETIRSEEATLQERLRGVVGEQRRLGVTIEQTRQAIALAESPVDSLETWIELTLDVASASELSLGIIYMVPCAAWRPAYRASLLARDGGTGIEIEAQAYVWQRTGEDWTDVELRFSTARPTLGASPPSLVDDRLSLRPKSVQEKRVVEVAVREETIQSAGEGGGGAATELPGLDDGGEVRVLAVPGKASIPSDGQPHKLALSRFQAPAQTERVCSPELSPLVSLVARFENKGASALLAGPVNLVRQSGFVGRGQLKFAGQGETVKLSFGSEDTLRIGRDVSSTDDESRLTGRRTTARVVKLFASNFGGEPVRVAIEERVPVSEVKEVEIRMLDDSKPSKDGIVRLEVSLGARQQQELKLSYEISAAGKVAGI